MRSRGGMANGVFGCAVIGIVILASLGLAFLGNADERQVDTTNWNYVTSANPAFTYDEAPARVDYSPPANVTGYTTDPNGSVYTSGISYVKSSVPTAYLAKTAPVYTSSGNVSIADLASNSRLDPVGSQDNDYPEYNNVRTPDTPDTVWESPAFLLKADKLKTAIESVASISIGTHTILTLESGSDNLMFAMKDWPNYAGVQMAGYEQYLITGATADKATVDLDSSVATLYKDGEPIGTASLTDLFMGIIGSSDTSLSFSYSTYVWSSEYINPTNGVNPVKASYLASPTLTSFAAQLPPVLFTGFHLDGSQITSVAYSEYTFHFTINTIVGAPCYISKFVEQHGGQFFGINDFFWTPTEPGTYEFILADEGYQYTVTYEGIAYPVTSPIELSIIVADLGNVYWANGYQNAAVDLMIQSFEGYIIAGGVMISCTSGYWSIDGVDVGTWPAIVVTYDMDSGVYATPVISFSNFTSYTLDNHSVVINTATTSPIKKLEFYVHDDVTLSVVETVVYLEGGGVYRVDSRLDMADKFPDYTTYNVTINGAPHWGDYITINGQTCAVDEAAGTVEISGVTFPLAGLTLAYSSDEFYYKGATYAAGHLVAINDNLAVDLGAVAGLVLQFNGTWYYETALYSGAAGTVTVVDWTPGVLGLDASAFAAVFTLLALVGLVVASRLGGGTWDYLVLGSAVLVGFIMCGVFI